MLLLRWAISQSPSALISVVVIIILFLFTHVYTAAASIEYGYLYRPRRTEDYVQQTDTMSSDG
jgi:hypothetical protein